MWAFTGAWRDIPALVECEGSLAMRPESEAHELEAIAKAFQINSKEISYEGLAKALLKEALSYSGAVARKVKATSMSNFGRKLQYF